MAERWFHPWGEPLLPQAAATLVREFAAPKVVDLGETLLVLPGSRAGRRLMELLWETAARERKRLVPPSAVLTIGSLPEKLYKPGLPLATDTEVRMAWARALEETPPKLTKELFGGAVGAVGWRARWATARRLVALHRELGGAGLNFREVAASCRKASLFSEEERWHDLADIQDRARTLLMGAGRIDREDARRDALGAGCLGSGKTLVLVGVAEAPPLVRRMLESVRDRILALIHAPAELAEGFDPLGILRKEAWLARPLSGVEDWVEVAEGPAEGAEAVVRFLAALDSGFAPEDVVIGVTQRDWVPFLSRSLELHALTCRYAEGAPVTLSPPGQLLRAVLNCLSEGTFRTMAALVRHPDLPPSWHPLRAPVEADRYFREFFPWRFPPQLAEEDEIGLDRGLHEAQATPATPSVASGAGDDGKRGEGEIPKFSTEARRLLAALAGEEAPFRRWMPQCLEVLKAVYGGWKVPSEDPYRAGVLEACLAIGEVAHELWSLPPALDRVCTGAEALAVLLQELEDVRLPPPPREDALEAVGWLELHLEDAPVVVLLGANEPYLPGSVSADPFLPNSLRSLLGLEDNEARLARDRYRLEALLRSARYPRLISLRKDAMGEALLPSRLLLRVPPREAAERLLRFLRGGGEGGRDTGIRPRPERPPGEGRFRLPPVRVISVPQIPQPLPVTAFARILEDPFLWALQEVLGLEETSDEGQELDPLAFGTLAHAVLEKFAWTQEAASTDLREIRRALERSLEEVFRQRFPFPPLPAVSVQREQLWARLQRFAEWQAQRVEDGWRIQAVELRTPRQGVPFLVDGEPVWLSARMDRLDRHETTGQWMILDYKTGEEPLRAESARDREGRWRDLQLPLYHYLVKHMVSKGGSPFLGIADPEAQVLVAYLNLAARPGPLDLSVAPWTPSELEEALEAARQVVRTLREQREVVFELGAGPRRLEGGWARLLGVGAFSSDAAEGEG